MLFQLQILKPKHAKLERHEREMDPSRTMRARGGPIAILIAIEMAILASTTPACATPVILGKTAGAFGPAYDGHGALSAGASSRLLFDYEPSVRSDILDWLFKPGLGAALPVLKIEIGGDGQSTDGTEPSFMHRKADTAEAGYQRGYEFWLAKEARKRNPNIKLGALAWTAPSWVGNGTYCSWDNVYYTVRWLQGARDIHGLKFDFIGLYNERTVTDDYLSNFVHGLYVSGFGDLEVVGGDRFANNLESYFFPLSHAKLVDAVGVHYPCKYKSEDGANALGKKLWASEDFSTEANWTGASCWGRTLNQNFVLGNMTSTIAWSLIWSVYRNLPYFGNGLMYADEPVRCIGERLCERETPGGGRRRRRRAEQSMGDGSGSGTKRGVLQPDTMRPLSN